MNQKYFRKGTVLTAFIILVFVFSTIGYSQAVKKPAKPKTVVTKPLKLKKPDIQIHEIKTVKVESLPNGDHKIKVKVTVKNVSDYKNCTGPFKIQFLRRTTSSGPYTPLPQAGVDKLCCDPSSMKLRHKTRSAEDTVPNGKTYYYKIKVDDPNMVSESNESNNSNNTDVKYKTPRTIPRSDLPAAARASDLIPDCDGVDLMITNVQVINGTHGMLLKATIKNRCAGSCTGPIVIEIDESDVLGADRGISQQIGGGIGSKQEFTMGSALGVAYDNDRDCHYIVKVVGEGGCSEPGGRLANNEYPVTIPRGARP